MLIDIYNSLFRIKDNYLSIFFKEILIVVAGIITYQFSLYGLRVAFKRLEGKIASDTRRSRLNTLRNIAENIMRVLVIGVFVLIIASSLGVNITPILTGAGILGLAVSFGSQSLVKDLISGFFLILENQVNIGDFVKIGGQEGKVRKIQMRNIVLKDKDNNTIYIPNSKIDKIIVYKNKLWERK